MAQWRDGLISVASAKPADLENGTRFPIGVCNVDLDQTLDGGQAFRWRSDGHGAYRGVLGSSILEFSYIDGDVNVEQVVGNADIDLLHRSRDYFNAGVDTDELQLALGNEPGYGDELYTRPLLRVLRQDPWECLVSFICSQNSNIPRIKQMISVVGAYGVRIGEHDWDFVYPSPSVVADIGETQLRALGLGYRAKHLSQAAKMVADGKVHLHKLRSASYKDAKSELMTLPGVGPKVADCVLAYSMDKTEAFPVDVHVRRAVTGLYGLSEKMRNDDIGEWARDRFGKWAATAQLYMFRHQINNS